MATECPEGPLERLVGCQRDQLSDPVVESVRTKLAERSAVGIRKYGTTVARTDLSRIDWLRHAQEEMLDGAVYLERLIQDEERAVAAECNHEFIPVGRTRARCIHCGDWD